MQQRFEEDEVRGTKATKDEPQDREAARPQGTELASAIGNNAVQRVARTPALQRSPAAAGLTPSGVLARQEDEGEEKEGEGGATPEAESAPEATPAGGGTQGAEGAAPATEAGGGGTEGAEEAAPATEGGGETAATEEEEKAA